LKLKATVEGIGKSMARLLGEQICLETVLCREDLMIMADYGQLEHILMNLCTNAKDAMPEGGILSLQTERVELGDDFITRHGYGCPSVYARISVIDTGVGIDKETRERIFEPFFTTKEAGKGTGLGLSIVYGLVKQHNGYINVYSQIGAGTVFNIYLPAIDRGIDEGRVLPLKRSQASHETILIARDDEPEGSLIGEVLRE
jgi:two-component system NtrC family sensor kinase